MRNTLKKEQPSWHIPYNRAIYHKPKKQGEFVVGKCVDGERIISSEGNFEKQDNELNIVKRSNNKPKYKYRTGRDPSMKLRPEILKRDNFKCWACGSSPAKDPAVELHIDHIIPWSRGGETIEENLQTLC